MSEHVGSITLGGPWQGRRAISIRSCQWKVESGPNQVQNRILVGAKRSTFVIKVAKHIRPTGHKNNKERKEHQTWNKLSLSSGFGSGRHGWSGRFRGRNSTTLVIGHTRSQKLLIFLHIEMVLGGGSQFKEMGLLGWIERGGFRGKNLVLAVVFRFHVVETEVLILVESPIVMLDGQFWVRIRSVEVLQQMKERLELESTRE